MHATLGERMEEPSSLPHLQGSMAPAAEDDCFCYPCSKEPQVVSSDMCLVNSGAFQWM